MPRKSNLPVKHKPSPPLIIQTPGSALGQTIKQGIAFGVGQSIAHRAIGILVGGSTPTEHVQVSSEKPEYVQCMRESKNNEEACKQFL